MDRNAWWSLGVVLAGSLVAATLFCVVRIQVVLHERMTRLESRMDELECSVRCAVDELNKRVGLTVEEGKPADGVTE